MTTTEKPGAASTYDFANERGTEEEEREVLLVGPSFSLFPEPRIDISNEKSPGSNKAELIFVPAAAAIEIIKETKTDAFANAGYNQDEPRLPAGQPGGGRWTSGDAAAADRQAKENEGSEGVSLSAAKYRKIAEEEAQKAALALEFLPGDDRKPQRWQQNLRGTLRKRWSGGHTSWHTAKRALPRTDAE